jgi:hypothetical protein
MELSMSKTNTVSPLRQRMIEDMTARKLNPHTQRSHIYSCKRFAVWLKRLPDTATAESPTDVTILAICAHLRPTVSLEESAKLDIRVLHHRQGNR